MNHEFAPIRKVIDGISINTDTAHHFHTDTKVVSELVDRTVVHRYMAQGLYQVLPDGPYFLAFWNRLQWDSGAMKFTYVDDASLIDVEQAKQWIRGYCPQRYDEFVQNMGQAGKAPSAVAVNLRMPSDLRAHLMMRADVTGSSFNKICMNMITAGLNHFQLFAPSSFVTLTMPSGVPALNELQRANSFNDADDQALANDAEQLYGFCRLNQNQFLPFALSALYRHFMTNRDEKRGVCFALWLAQFHRPSWQDQQEFRQRRPGPVEYGAWRWVKNDPPFDKDPELGSRFS
ncbi:hypothetical protein [Paraburkholderia sp. HP33-1]|uniref:hypothetical protein n=1 Tax=Paraburkholderia sp. HP33-1 TaxID=2883243 RepID=UPI001F27F1A1|nr:hypothetical protein [Paraburkholderia sp. HP33-1]